MAVCGLLGGKLGHSYSPAIHGMLADYDYRLFEKTPEQLESFLRGGQFHGLNVTIPYKKAVIPYCTHLTPIARELGSVNTIVRREDGTLLGDNTDAFGFLSMVRASGIRVQGKKALVLGSGGASVTVCACLRQLGAASVTVISRSGEDNYQNLHRHADAHILVNTTPVGMYPGNGVSPVDLAAFPRCEGVLDVVYNPARTALLLQAEALGIPHYGGLHMLVAQAKASAEQFAGHSIPDSEIARIEKTLSRAMENIILIGMPGSGKSTVAAALGRALGREVADADALVEQQAGMSIPDIFAREQESGFRARETRALEELGKRSGTIISTGGGCVLREENYPLLHQNGTIVWLKRDLTRLDRAGRPLSQGADLEQLYAVRKARYERFSDCIVDNNGPVEDTVKQILEGLA